MFLSRIPYRYLTRHPWQSLLMVFGIALGVAVAVAIDLANESAGRAFSLSTDAVAGRATHVILGSPSGLPETLYADLRRLESPIEFSPVVNEYFRSPELGDGIYQLLGIDPFAEPPFRNYLGSASNPLSTPELVEFLTQPGSLILSIDTAKRNGLAIGDKVTVEIGGERKEAFIAALVQPRDNLSRQALSNIVLADIATAQEITGKVGKLDRIDLIMPKDREEEYLNQIKENLPTGIIVEPVEAREGNIEQMTEAFGVNLTALSLLALVVGLFLIYNTITFSVIKRRYLFGILRSLGVTRTEVFVMVVGEALLVGVAGTALGLVLGIIMGQGAVKLVTRTINDLFFVVSVQGLQVPIPTLIKGALLGVVTTVLAATAPAWEAASVAPRIAMSRSGLEHKARTAVWLAVGGGVLLLLIGSGLLFLPSKDLWISFGGTAAVVIGFAMLAPAATILLATLVTPVTSKIWGGLGKMAPRNVVNSVSRTAVATAALMVAISVTIGVSLMISSFRYTVVLWLGQILQGDIYISAPGILANQTSAAIDEEALQALESYKNAGEIHFLRSVMVDSPEGLVHIAAASHPGIQDAKLFTRLDVALQALPEALAQGAVIITEPFANRYGLIGEGTQVMLYTDRGLVSFPIVGIYYDYGSTQGTVLMSLDVYRKYWADPVVTSVAIVLHNNSTAEQVVEDLEKELNPLQNLSVRLNRSLREEVLAVFDRTFTITGALQILATAVAFIGVLSALLSLEMERQRELGILRTLGLTGRQLWGLVMLETGLLGSVAGLLAAPAGYILSLILVYIINQRSFGWTLQMQVQAMPFVKAFFLAVSAALLAGIYPAWRMSHIAPADAARFE